LFEWVPVYSAIYPLTVTSTTLSTPAAVYTVGQQRNQQLRSDINQMDFNAQGVRDSKSLKKGHKKTVEAR